MAITTTPDGTPIVIEDSSPPSNKLPPGEWIQKNLFSSPFNAILTLLILGVGSILVFLLAAWIIAADWEIVRVNLRLFMIGRFPREELWRPWASGYLVLTAIGLSTGAVARSAHELAIEQEIPSEKESIGGLIRRFWAVLAVIVLYVSFARTPLPYVGVAVAVVLVIVMREVGWNFPASIRRSALFIGALLLIASVFVLAGSSNLMGWTVGIVMFLWAGAELGRRVTDLGAAGAAKRWAPALVIAVASYVIVRVIPLEGFGWEDWGGLHLTLFTAVIGIVLGMPIGTLLAVARRSDLPLVQSAAVLFIEFVRGVPLISLLLFSQLMLPLFLPRDFERPASLTLAIFVIMLFSAAYVAEIVRGGLQAVPKGQSEAAQASGMSAFNVQRLIVLPQALRASIPAMVGQFISLFKDTSLLLFIGIAEFLNVSLIANSQNEFVGASLAPLTYSFVAVGFWAFAYTLSKESRRLESKLGVGTR